MNVADIVILVVIALSMLFGLLRGFLTEILSLACWVAAFWVAWAFGHAAARGYAGVVRDPTVAIVAGYVTCFVAVLVAGAVLGWMLRGFLRRSHLQGGDHALGALFGIARGLVLVTFAVLMLGFTSLPQAVPWWRQSVLLPPLSAVADDLARSLPPDVTHYLELGGRSLQVGTSGLPAVPAAAARRAARRLGLPAAASSAPAPASPRDQQLR